MSFIAAALLYIGTTVVNALMRPRLSSTPSRAGAEQFTIPTVDPSRVIPVAWGSVHVKDANVIWWGHLRRTVFHLTNIYQPTPNDTAFNMFFVSVQVGICHGPVDYAVPSVYWDNRAAVPLSIEEFGSWSFLRVERLKSMIDPVYYGTPVDWDGWADAYRFFRGTQDQPADFDLPLPTKIGAPVPPWLGLCHCHLTRVGLGPANNGTPYMQALAFGVVRRPNGLGLGSGRHVVGNDANPACLLWELLTDRIWGCGLPESSLDVAAFRAAGDALHAEGFGMSWLLSSSRPAREVAAEILRHVDGAMFTDPVTALLTVKLARNDYAFADLPVFDESVASDVELSRPLWSETRNQVRVTYQGPNGTERVATESNLANFQLRGVLSPVDIVYQGVTAPALAQRLAARDLKTASYPFARVSFSVNRKGWPLRPCGVVRLTSARLGFQDLVVRITRISQGYLTDGRIRVDAVEDQFAVNWTGMDEPGEGWVDPVQPPGPLLAQRLEENPYALAGGPVRQVVALAARGEAFLTGYEVWSDPLGGEAYARTNTSSAFTPSGVLAGSMGYKSSLFTIEQPSDIASVGSITAAQLAQGRNLCLIDDEWIAWLTVTDHGDGRLTFSGCVRGVLDTTPRLHATGARAWFPSAGSVLTESETLALEADAVVKADLVDQVSAQTVTLVVAPGAYLVVILHWCTTAGSAGLLSTVVSWTSESGARSIKATADLALDAVDGDAGSVPVYVASGNITVTATPTGAAGSPKFSLRARAVPL